MSGQRPRVLVVQFGARRGYAVPAALERAGILEALYTDFCVGRGLGRLAPLIEVLPPLARRLNTTRRRPPPGVLARTRVFQRWGFDMQRALRRKLEQEARIEALDRAHRRAGQRMTSFGFGHATHLLTMFGEGRGFIDAAKRDCLTVVSDLNIAPSAEAIVLDEQRRHPDWEERRLFYGDLSRDNDPDFGPLAAILRSTDIYLCPSDFVHDDLVNNFGVAVQKTHLLPYAVNPLWSSVNNDPEPGRILFAGTAGLRKGIHILAEAARILQSRGRQYHFKVAGKASERVRQHPMALSLEFLGHLSTTNLQDEFATADVLALPSLAEGSAGVTYEALGCGLPIVTTQSAGSVVKDGVHGRIVPERDPIALANALEEIVESRITRSRMAAAASKHAESYSWRSYQEKLLNILSASTN